MIPGRGVQALTEGLSVLAGNRELLEENGAIIPPQALGRAEQLRGEGCTLIFTAVDGRFAGLLALSDQLRESAAIRTRAIGTACWNTPSLPAPRSGRAAPCRPCC